MANWISLIFLLFVCNRGFGWVEIYELAVSLFTALYASKYLAQKNKTGGVVFIILFAISIMSPSIFLLWGMIVILLLLSERKFAIVPLSFWLIESTGFYPSTYSCVTAILILLYIVAIAMPIRYCKYLNVGIILLVVGFEICSLFPTKTVIEDKNYNVYGKGQPFSVSLAVNCQKIAAEMLELYATNPTELKYQPLLPALRFMTSIYRKMISSHVIRGCNSKRRGTHNYILATNIFLKAFLPMAHYIQT